MSNFRDMNMQRIRRVPTATRKPIRRTSSAVATAALLVATTALPSAAEPVAHPIAGDIVTCTIGKSRVPLLGKSGRLIKEEITRVDQQGRAHTVFTIKTRHARLTGPRGTVYRLKGGGFDRVLYPTEVNTGDALREHIAYHFDVIGPRGRIGVVRFRMRVTDGGPPAITDTSTCRLPEN
jgi:hypothetical protein